MPNASMTISDIAVHSIEYFTELLRSLNNDYTDFVPCKAAIQFLSSKMEIEIDLFLSKSNSSWVNPIGICFIEFWRLYEELLKHYCLINFVQDCDGILYGMIYLRDRIIDETTEQNKLSRLDNSYTIDQLGVKSVGLTVEQIHSIILEIISKDICNESSTYWQDVLNQIPQDENSIMFLELVDISNSILQWLREYLDNRVNTTICTNNYLTTNIISARGGTDNSSVKAISSYKTNVVDKDVDCNISSNSIIGNSDNGETYIDSSERLPWKGQTMFSNFRELQISLQYIQERVIMSSDKEKNSYFLKRDENAIRKISHMITELEDYLYSQIDILNKERYISEQIKSENRNLRKQLKSLIKESEEYKFDVQNSNLHKNRSEKETEQFILQKNKLSSDLIRYKEENRTLEKKYENLLYNFNELKEMHEILLEENRQLITEINRPNEESQLLAFQQIDVCNDQEIHRYTPRISLDPSMIGHRVTDYTSRPKSNTVYRKDSHEIKDTCDTESGGAYKVPAIIGAIPDFLESYIQNPVSCQTYRKKNGYFPGKVIGWGSRVVRVVPTITENNLFGNQVGPMHSEHMIVPFEKGPQET
ncbi:putative coiled-coil protein [Cryptosporidium canis]|uniref:Coiled-coil protein n=1 Tax=Cryptosporidium canis TaxID=195482 RepID=A0ABQ8P8W0_9CRYT|nr:putative coiled-coil protein [Cryptosporidium canis]KAJ1614729.1 putative coiled-coil protein [Cryptosporidium canis]